jgi:hypothetical protein
VTFQNGYVYVIYCSWINPPHDKISLCIDEKNNWFFWFNSNKKVHDIGQVPAPNGCHGSIVKECFLDISSVKTFSPNDLATARDRGPLNDPFKTTVRDALTAGVKLLPPLHSNLALAALK